MNLTNSEAYLLCIESTCGEQYSIDQRIYTCSRCGSLLEVQYSFNLPGTPDQTKTIFSERRTINNDLERSGVWRFRELLPFVQDLSTVITLSEGNTPIYRAPRCAEYAGLTGLNLKHQ